MAGRGIDGTSMDAVAERAGVSKATIYNHWPDKEGLLLEALADLHGLRQRPVFDSGDTRADLVAVLAYRSPKEQSAQQKKILPHFIAYGARKPRFGLAWRSMVLEPPRRELTRLLEQGVRRGELMDLPDLELALALLLGPILYRHIFAQDKSSAWGDLPEPVVAAFWKAFGSPGPREPQFAQGRQADGSRSVLPFV